MFIKQTIEFELRSPGPPGRTCNPKTGYLHAKQRTPRKIKSSSAILFTAKYIAEGNVPCFTSPGPSQLQNLSKKC